MKREKPLILFIEDEPDIYDVLLAMCELWDYEAVAFVDGEEALPEIEKLLPDLILLDIRLPGTINGIDLLQHIRATPITSAIPVIMMTAFKSLEIVAETLKLGADDFMFKPLPPVQELKARLDTRMLFRQLQSEDLTRNQISEKPVFISYSRRDWTDFVEPLVSRLKAEKIYFWIDQQFIEGSDDWLDEINKALKESARVIVCVSPDALNSRYVKMEYRYAFNNGKRLYPVVCRECDLPAELQILHYYKYDQLDDLIRALKSK